MSQHSLEVLRDLTSRWKNPLLVRSKPAIVREREDGHTKSRSTRRSGRADVRRIDDVGDCISARRPDSRVGDAKTDADLEAVAPRQSFGAYHAQSTKDISSRRKRSTLEVHSRSRRERKVERANERRHKSRSPRSFRLRQGNVDRFSKGAPSSRPSSSDFL